MTVITSTNAGFFANLCDVIRHIYMCSDGYWFVNWGEESLYYDSERGENVFNYFFTQSCNKNMLMYDHKKVCGYIPIPLTGDAFRDSFNTIFNNYIKFNKDTWEAINKVQGILDVNEKTLGVHIRYTDKLNGAAYGEPASARPIDLEVYIDLVKRRLYIGQKYDSVYLATDDERVSDKFAKIFGNKLKMIQAPRSKSDEPIHSGHRDIPGYEKGLSVLIDVMMLSRCGFLIRSTSNVSSFAQFINLDLNHINVNEVLQGDTREHEYGLISQPI